MQNPKVDLIVGNLTEVIESGLERAATFYALVAFVRLSGISSLLSTLQKFVQAGGEVKLLTGDYLYVTEPEALEAIWKLGPDVEARLWRSHGRSFHPKAYLFDSDESAEVIVGSSNLSLSGLTSGIEWNLRVTDAKFPQPDPFDAFQQLFYSDATVPINQVTIAAYRKEHASRSVQPTTLWTTEDRDDPFKEPLALAEADDDAFHQGPLCSPRDAQIEALEALVETQREGFAKGLVVLPTGLGKTFLAAFFANRFHRVLFVAHREEILRQAEQTFRAVMPERTTARYRGPSETMANTTFASVYTLSAKRHRERFLPDCFDLIIIDEFHHAAARSYEALIQHFTPQFLLGLTATPERTDNKDVYAICDGNLVYDLSLGAAISRQWLVPFLYYAVYDPIDYGSITWRGRRYDEWELTQAQLRDDYGQAVVAAWQKYHGQRTLVFCSSRVQSRYLAEQFMQRGIRARHVDGTTPTTDRQIALQQLASGDLDAICSVDLFNEGVDIPVVDTILLARPSDSMVVFLQQIGRGLRRAEGKHLCTIIDLVGNYRHVDQRLTALGVISLAAWTNVHVAKPELPGGSEIHVDDFKVIELLTRLQRRITPRRAQLKEAYVDLKLDLGHRPSYLEFHLKSGTESQWIRREYGSYMGFLSVLEELNPEEKQAFEQGRDWIETVERTLMQRSYKMVLLKMALRRGSTWIAPLSALDAAQPFYDYLHAARYRQADCDAQAVLRQSFSPPAVAALITTMPIHHLVRSSPAQFHWVNGQLTFTPGVTTDHLETVRLWTEQVVDYRLHVYFYRPRSLSRKTKSVQGSQSEQPPGESPSNPGRP